MRRLFRVSSDGRRGSMLCVFCRDGAGLVPPHGDARTRPQCPLSQTLLGPVCWAQLPPQRGQDGTWACCTGGAGQGARGGVRLGPSGQRPPAVLPEPSPCQGAWPHRAGGWFPGASVLGGGRASWTGGVPESPVCRRDMPAQEKHRCVHKSVRAQCRHVAQGEPPTDAAAAPFLRKGLPVPGSVAPKPRQGRGPAGVGKVRGCLLICHTRQRPPQPPAWAGGMHLPA